MYKRIGLFLVFLGLASGAFAQETDTTKIDESSFTSFSNFFSLFWQNLVGGR